MSYSSINRLKSLKGKNSLVFCDFGVSFRSDTKFTKVDNDTKYRKHLETIEKLSFLGAKVIIAPKNDSEIGLISRNFEKLLKLNPKFNSQVIFYDNVPSSIRYVQRRGRTGRKDTGKLVVLIAKNTIDETYYWIGKRKMTAAKSMGEKMTKVLEKNQEIESKKTGLDAFL